MDFVRFFIFISSMFLVAGSIAMCIVCVCVWYACGSTANAVAAAHHIITTMMQQKNITFLTNNNFYEH